MRWYELWAQSLAPILHYRIFLDAFSYDYQLEREFKDDSNFFNLYDCIDKLSSRPVSLIIAIRLQAEKLDEEQFIEQDQKETA